MKRTITRKDAERFCTLEIRLQNGRLSITGTEGRIITRARARAEALDYWTSYFDEVGDEETTAFCDRWERSSRASPRIAARAVLRADGEFHGLDIEHFTATHVYVTESCGQIRETLEEWFPGVDKLFAWHLNDMQAGCEHQRVNNTKEFCEICQYKYGSAWLKMDLPPAIAKLAETFAADEKDAA